MAGRKGIVDTVRKILRANPDKEYLARELAPLVSVEYGRKVSSRRVACNIAERSKGIRREKVVLPGNGRTAYLYSLEGALI